MPSLIMRSFLVISLTYNKYKIFSTNIIFYILYYITIL